MSGIFFYKEVFILMLVLFHFVGRKSCGWWIEEQKLVKFIRKTINIVIAC